MAGRFSVMGSFGATDHLTRVFGRIEKGARRVLTVAEGAGARLRTSLGGIAAHTDRVMGGIASSAKLAALAGGTALAGGLAIGITRGAEFEQKLADVAAVSGAAGAELAAMRARAIELGSTTKFAGAEVVGAMESMAKAGFATKDVLSGVSGLLSAAAADGGDLGEISTSLMSTLKGMGAGADQLQNFADMMAKAGDSTSASIGSIAESMVKFGPVARQLNVSAASSFAQLSLLQDAGMDASSAGTQLAAVYSKLVAPLGTTKREIAALGLTITDAAGNMKAPERLFTEILQATDGIAGNAGKMAAFTNLVGLESKTAMLNIAAAAKSGKLGALTKDLESAAGYADQIAAKRMNTLTGDWKLFGGAVDGVTQSLFSMQGGALREIVQSATAWLRANRELIVTKLDAWVGTLKTSVLEAIPIVQWFGRGLVSGFRDVSGAGAAVVRIITKITGATTGLFGESDAVQAFNFGRALVWTGAALLGVSVASRVATVAAYGYRAATLAVRGVVAAATGIKAAYVAITRGDTLATIANTAASWASRAATLARSGITAIATGAQWLYTAATVSGTAALGPAAAATWALVAPLVAAAAAIGSLVILWKQLDELATQTGGWVGIWEGIKSTFSGDGFFAGADENLNRKAKEEARLREEAKKRGISPEQSAAKAAAVASGVPAAKQADVMVGNQGLFDSLLGGLSGMPDMKGLSGNTDEASKQLEALTASLGQFSSLFPTGIPGQLPGSMPGEPGASPAPMSMPTPQLVMPADLSIQNGKLIAAEVRRVLEQTRIQVDVNGSGATATVAKKPRAGVNVTDSGAM